MLLWLSVYDDEVVGIDVLGHPILLEELAKRDPAIGHLLASPLRPSMVRVVVDDRARARRAAGHVVMRLGGRAQQRGSAPARQRGHTSRRRGVIVRRSALPLVGWRRGRYRTVVDEAIVRSCCRRVLTARAEGDIQWTLGRFAARARRASSGGSKPKDLYSSPFFGTASIMSFFQIGDPDSGRRDPVTAAQASIHASA